MTNPQNGLSVALLARAAGVSDRDLVPMVAIAFRESRWDADATNHNTNGTWDHGLWQINRPTLDRRLLDPKANALAMSALYKSRGLEPWTYGTHGRDTYRDYLPQAKEAVGKADQIADLGGPIHDANLAITTGAVSKVTDALDPLAALLGGLAEFLGWLMKPSNWIRLGETLAGAILVLVGIWFLWSNTKTGQNVNASTAKAAKSAAVVAA